MFDLDECFTFFYYSATQPYVSEDQIQQDQEKQNLERLTLSSRK